MALPVTVLAARSAPSGPQRVVERVWLREGQWGRAEGTAAQWIAQGSDSETAPAPAPPHGRSRAS